MPGALEVDEKKTIRNGEPKIARIANKIATSQENRFFLGGLGKEALLGLLPWFFFQGRAGPAVGPPRRATGTGTPQPNATAQHTHNHTRERKRHRAGKHDEPQSTRLEWRHTPGAVVGETNQREESDRTMTDRPQTATESLCDKTLWHEYW
jgi:hypothetical protein